MTNNQLLIKKLEDNSEVITESGCRLWLKSESVGYGHLFWNGRQQLTHRLSYEAYKGVIPKGICVLHKCDIPSCINPNHLFLGTKRDNAIDRIKKGRFPQKRGDKNPFIKLTDAQIVLIRVDNRKQRVIAREYGVSQQHISAIKNMKERLI